LIYDREKVFLRLPEGAAGKMGRKAGAGDGKSR
jgi:hypothetical protein